MTVTRQGRSFVLSPTPVPRFSKRLPLEDLDGPGRMWDAGLVGGRDGHTLEAFLAWRFEDWNGRFSIWHLCVNANARRHGLARALVLEAEAIARAKKAVAMWLEVSNLNVPAITAYEALGFTVVGLDTSLYQGTPARGEVALFMARDLSHP
jgi:ribosomal protein S18 acetylase RimI-like enzyme